MEYPPLLRLKNESAYSRHFYNVYCKSPVKTFDGYLVYFSKNNFNHAFFKSSRKNYVKDSFAYERAERMDWIKIALQDPNAELYNGWDNKKKKTQNDRRVAIVMGNYVVIIRFNKQKSKAFFVTAFIADSQKTIDLIRSNQIWNKKSR